MGNYKTIIAGVLLAIGYTTAVKAETPEPTLTVLLTDGYMSKQYNIDDISDIIFMRDLMIVNHAQGTMTFFIDDIDALRFDIELGAAAAEQVLAPGVTVSASDGIVTITAEEGTPLAVSVFDIGGRMLQNFHATTTTSIDMTALTPGIYIIKANNKVIKYKN